MPKISKLKKLRQEAGAKVGRREKPKQDPELKFRYERSRYHSTGIELYIEVSNCLLDTVRSDEVGSPPKYVDDFLCYCFQVCKSVSFITNQHGQTIQRKVEDFICEAFANTRLLSYKRANVFGWQRYKFIKSKKFNAFNTLIIDPSPQDYAHPSCNNVIVPTNHSGDRTKLYDEIVDLIAKRRRNQSIMAHAKKFCETSLELRVPVVAPVVFLDKNDILRNSKGLSNDEMPYQLYRSDSDSDN